MLFAETRSQQGPTQTVILEFALQSRIERLIAAGTWRGDDLIEMRAEGLQFAWDISDPGSPVVACKVVGLERQITAWWDRFDPASIYSNDP